MSGIVVIARQRSGTNFLRSLLASSTDLPNLGEVFDHKAGRRDINFFPFQACFAASQQPPRGRAECIAELTAYFDDLCGLFPRHIIDIKYNQTLICAPTFASPAELPPVLEVLRARGYAVVHLVRETVCATIMSDHVAKATGTWHLTRDAAAEVPPVKVRIDPATFIGECQRREREIAMFGEFLGQIGGVMPVRYEDLAEASPEQARPVIESICALAGVECRRVGQSYFRKGLGHWLDYVENAAELVAAMAAAPAVRRHVEGVVPAGLVSGGLVPAGLVSGGLASGGLASGGGADMLPDSTAGTPAP